MAEELSFDDWFSQVKAAFAANGIALPEDIEMMELAHMEYLESEESVDESIQRVLGEYR